SFRPHDGGDARNHRRATAGALDHASSVEAHFPVSLAVSSCLADVSVVSNDRCSEFGQIDGITQANRSTNGGGWRAYAGFGNKTPRSIELTPSRRIPETSHGCIL